MTIHEAIYSSSEGFIILSVILGMLAIYVTTISRLMEKQNYQTLETYIMYRIGLLCITVAISLGMVIYPFVQYFLGHSYLTVALSLLYVLGITGFTLLNLKKVQEKYLSLLITRNENQFTTHHANDKSYPRLRLFMYVWGILAIVMTISYTVKTMQGVEPQLIKVGLQDTLLFLVITMLYVYVPSKLMNRLLNKSIRVEESEIEQLKKTENRVTPKKDRRRKTEDGKESTNTSDTLLYTSPINPLGTESYGKFNGITHSTNSNESSCTTSTDSSSSSDSLSSSSSTSSSDGSSSSSSTSSSSSSSSSVSSSSSSSDSGGGGCD